jgi:P-type conjugative transfer protein TrbJ
VAVAAVAGLAAVLGPARRASAFLDFIIFDPSALAEHVQQVLQLAQQVEQATQQVQGTLLELKHLRGDAMPDAITTVTSLAKRMQADVYETTRPADQLGHAYPTDLSGVSPDRYAADQAGWARAERAALAENRRVQNGVEQDMPAAADRVQQIVAASNAAPGETAAVQAHNDLLAVTSGELAKLQMLRVARSRLRTEQLARGQSEQAYSAAQRAAVRDGWDAPSAPTEGLVRAFGD